MITNLAHIHDKKFAVMLVEDDGSEDGRWTVLSVIARWHGGHLFVNRGTDEPEFPVPVHALDRVKPVPRFIREVLHEAEYFVPLAAGLVPAGVGVGSGDAHVPA